MIEKLKKKYNCNELHVKHDEESGCTFIIAMNTVYAERGNGGTRMMNYGTVDEGIEDALRLANAMTKKCVIIGKENNGGYSGGKGVIIGDPKTQKTPEMLRNYGKFVQSLKGKFQTGSDMNITPYDLEHMAKETEFVDGLPSTGLGNGGAATAFGTIVAMKAMCDFKYGSKSLKDRKIAVQGVGSVGSALVKGLVEKGVEVVVADINPDKLKAVKVDVVKPEDIYKVRCDIFSPNARGGILTKANIAKLNCDMVIGAANNPLADELKSVMQMKKKGIIFAPDYVVNIGAQVLAICEVQGKSYDHAIGKIEEIIEARLEQIIVEAEKKNETLYEAAERIVSEEMG